MLGLLEADVDAGLPVRPSIGVFRLPDPAVWQCPREGWEAVVSFNHFLRVEYRNGRLRAPTLGWNARS